MHTVTFTDLQLEEIRHKLSILVSEPDLLEDYALTESQVEAWEGMFSNAGPHSVSDDLADVLTGELENCIDIARGNLDCACDDEMYQIRGYINSMNNAIKKLTKG